MTKAGEVDLNVPRLRTLPFESAIIERYKRREISIEEALVHVFSRSVRTPNGRYHGSSVGDPGQCLNGQQAQPKGLHEDRRVA